MHQPSARSLFLTHAALLRAGGGGAQWCTREYLRTLESAGLRPSLLDFDNSASILVRLRQRLRPAPFGRIDADAITRRVARAAREQGARWCFLNNTDAGLLAPLLRRRAPALRLVFLSHGVELTDVVNNLRRAPARPPPAQRRPAPRGALLLAEVAQRQALDATLCISEPDCVVESWLGSPATLFLPRQIPSDPLSPTPLPGRVGCVSTLDHGPNFEGLQRLAEALRSHPEIELRLVGGPEKPGRELAARFPGVNYLGRLDDQALRAEAATWRAFANPIFCAARGASTKVATALGWGLPVFTTPHGARGYRWPADTLPPSETPADLAASLARAATSPDPAPWFRAADALRSAAPSLPECAELLRAFLASLPERPSHPSG